MSAKLAITKNVEEREVTLKRVLNGPRDLVWQCLTNAKYIDQWWGPEGWTTETKTLDARVGGIWHYRMHGSGREVWGLVTYEELCAPEFIAYTETASNIVGEKIEGKQQYVTITLAELDGAQADIAIRTRFKSIAALEAMVRMGMAEGYSGALDKLETLIKKEDRGTK